MSASSDPSVTVGLIGVGNMGASFAERILAAGYPLVVYSRTPAKAHALGARGAAVAESPQDLARRADVVLTSLPDDRALEDVAEQVLGVAGAGTVLVDTSTVSPAASAHEEPLRGRDAIRERWASAVAAQADVTFGHEPLAVAGGRGLARWWASFAVPAARQRVRLEGIFQVALDDDGSCYEFREWWNAEEEPLP